MEQTTIPKPIAGGQSSIRSFFQPRQANYVSPPSSSNSNINENDRIYPTPTTLPHPPSPPTVQAEPDTGPLKSRSGTASPTQASISPIHDKYVQQLRRINSLLLPINYPDSFYHKIVDPQNTPNFSRVILFHEPLALKSAFSSGPEPKVVGGIVCRLEKDESTRTSAVYIQSLALLSPYRARGLVTRVLDNIIEGVVNTPQIGYPVTSLYAHVWTENSEGLKWYAARGFIREEPVVQDYYRRLQPGTAWIMRRPLVPSDHIRHLLKSNGLANSQGNPFTSPPSPPAVNSATASGHPSRAPSALPRTNIAPTLVTRAASYQNNGPGHEWNDLPDDIITGKSKPHTPEPYARVAPADNLRPNATISAAGSTASSRSSSRNGAKKKRQYPAAAFSSVASEKEKENS